MSSAFLNGVLEELIYMIQPKGCIDIQFPNKVCLLHKSLHGLRQSSRAWYHKIHVFLVSIGFISSTTNSNIYIKRKGDVFILIALYVDDTIIIKNDLSCLLLATKTQFKKEYSMTDLGSLKYVYGIQRIIDNTSKKVYLIKHQYIKDILKQFNMDNCKSFSTSLEISSKQISRDDPLSPEEQLEMNKILYRKAVGYLNHASVYTRPDISFAVGQVSKYLSSPQPQDWTDVKRIF